MTKDDFIKGWCEFGGSVSWEARKCWEYGQIHGDPFHFLNLPALTMPTCRLKCQRCKRELDIDFQHIRHAAVYDYDCHHCNNCNCFSSISAIAKLDRFRRRCERYEQEWERLNNPPSEEDEEDHDCVTRHLKRQRRGVPAGLRWRVLTRDNFRCRYCGASPDASELHVDHMNPRVLGGSDELDNLVTACIMCNLGKGAQSFRPVTLVLAPNP